MECVVYLCVCVACMHVLFFLEGLQNGPEEVQGWGVAVCDNGTGGYSDLPGRVTHEQDGGMTCVQMLMFFSSCFIFLEEVRLCDVKVDCKSVRLLTGQPKILKKSSQGVYSVPVLEVFLQKQIWLLNQKYCLFLYVLIL